jgi:hypothetical protein
MSFLLFCIIWLALIIGVVIVVCNIFNHMKSLGYEQSFPFSPNELFRFIATCEKTKKETSDGKLKVLLLTLNSLFVIALIVFFMKAFL